MPAQRRWGGALRPAVAAQPGSPVPCQRSQAAPRNFVGRQGASQLAEAGRNGAPRSKAAWSSWKVPGTPCSSWMLPEAPGSCGRCCPTARGIGTVEHWPVQLGSRSENISMV